MDIKILEQWLILFNTYGWPAVMFIFIIIVWFIPWVKKMQSRDTVVASVDKKEEVERMSNFEIEITNILTEAGKDVDADWAVLWQFHNGTNTVAGLPFIKMSVTNEYAKYGVTPRSEKYQGIPIGVFADAVARIETDGFLRVDLNSEYKAIANSYKTDGVECGYLFRINNVQGNFVGILSVSYRSCVDLNESQINIVKGYGARIAMTMVAMAATFSPRNRRKGDKKD